MCFRSTVSAVRFTYNQANQKLTRERLPDLHDVSWGTKGSDKSETLASVQTTKSGKDDEAVVEIEEQTQASIDERFKQSTSAITLLVVVSELTLPPLKP